MIAYDTQAPVALDAPASRGVPQRRPSSWTALLHRVLHNVAVFTLLLTLALAPLAFRLYLIMR
jgi:hypothetical protein